MIDFGKCYKDIEKCSNGFWSAKKSLTYGRPIIAVTGTRSVGKSTGVACLSLINYVRTGHKFMYIRRRKEDTQKTAKTFFTNAIAIIKSNTDIDIKGFKALNGKYYIALKENEDGELIYEECGIYYALSREEELKSSVFSEYNIIIYDEFISKDANKYLGTKANYNAEWDAMVSLYQTVDRGIGQPFRNETVIFLLGNKATVYNPIFLSLNIVDYITEDAHFTAPKNKVWVWEDVDLSGITAVQELEKSFAYQMSSDNTKKYAYENKGIDNSIFIKKPDGATQYKGTFVLKGERYGVEVDNNHNFYIGKPKDGYAQFSVDVDSHDANDLYLIQRWSESPLMMMIAVAYKQGRLYFYNGKIKAMVLKYLEFMP